MTDQVPNPAHEHHRPARHFGVVLRKGTTGLGPNLATELLDVTADGVGVRTLTALARHEDVEVEITPPGSGKVIKLRGAIGECRTIGDGTFLAEVRLRHRLSYPQLAELTR